MALYFLDYDIREGHDYQPLYDELSRLNAVHVLESLWCFHHDRTDCLTLRNHFLQFLHPGDRLVVSDVRECAATDTIERIPGKLVA
jgi:hypothetical protein